MEEVDSVGRESGEGNCDSEDEGLLVDVDFFIEVLLRRYGYLVFEGEGVVNGELEQSESKGCEQVVLILIVFEIFLLIKLSLV